MAKQTVGRDLSVSFTIGGNVIQQFGLHTDTHFQPQWTLKKVTPTNFGGIPVARSIYEGIDVELTFSRVNGTADILMQFLQDNWIAGNPDVVVTMQQTVRNSDGTISQYNYLNGTIYPTEGGSYKGSDDVSQIFKFFFPESQLISDTSGAITISGAPLS
jgi:hypothetical protein